MRELEKAMAFRDDSAVYKERIDHLELQLAKMTGRAMLAMDERDGLRDELEQLTRDPKALARIRTQHLNRSSLYIALRVLGALLVAAIVVTMLIFSLGLMANDAGAGLICAAFPLLLTFGVLLLKLPELVQALELRFERKRQARRAMQIAEPPKLRVAPAEEQEVEGNLPADERTLRAPR